jgi:predicted esterase
VLQVHGTADQVVNFMWGENSNKLLGTMITPPPKFMSVPGMGHSSHPSEIEEVKKFINEQLNK